MSDFSKQIQPQILNISPYIPGKPISELQRELNLTRISKLASNENPIGSSPKVKKAIQDLLKDISSYPDGSAYQLKQTLSKKLNIDTNQIVIGNGSNELLELVARVFAAKGEQIIFSQYAFAIYAISTQIVGASAQCVPAKSWGHDLTAMLKAITQNTKIIYIANPNNPTGTLISKQEWDSFIKQVPPQIIVVLDEAYFEYVAKDKVIDGINYLNKHPNLLVCRTFSKAYGLASLRIGYMMGCPEIIAYIEQIRAPFNVNQFAQVAANSALDDDYFVKETVALNNKGMLQLTNFFKKHDLEFIPSFGNFVCVNVGKNAIKINQQLLELGVIVRPIANYDMHDFLRISIGTTAENQHFIEALSKILCK